MSITMASANSSTIQIYLETDHLPPLLCNHHGSSHCHPNWATAITSSLSSCFQAHPSSRPSLHTHITGVSNRTHDSSAENLPKVSHQLKIKPLLPDLATTDSSRLTSDTLQIVLLSSTVLSDRSVTGLFKVFGIHDGTKCKNIYALVKLRFLLMGNKQQAINMMGLNNMVYKKVTTAMENKEKLERNWKCRVWTSKSRL